MLRIFGIIGNLLKNNDVDSHAKELIFLNLPLSEDDVDLIGVSKYVSKLTTAIEKNAQFIALTSEFGSGKTSIIHRLENKFVTEKKYEVIKINLWISLIQSKTILDIHKSFLYQLASQIDVRKGTYINKRLSKNYGLISILSKNKWHKILSISIVFLFFMIKILEYTSSKFGNLYIIFQGLDFNLFDSIVFTIYLVIALVITYLIFDADIIFSSNKSEGNRTIDENEIIDLYRTLILEEKNLFIESKHYIIVLEDLDRSNDPIKVLNFLKEFRKYYQPSNNKLQNKATFIINLKTESAIKSNMTTSTEKNLFSKIFDLVINVQKINIDNYDVILNGLIEEKKEYFYRIGFNTRPQEIKGMQWHIRNLKDGIREIKDRLNLSLTLYETLTSRFGKNIINYEKCAIASYILTRYTDEMCVLNDDTFQKIIEKYIEKNGIDNEVISEVIGNEKIKKECDFINEIKILIEDELINVNYRMYFYNYPKGSHLYDLNEQSIFDIIYYKKQNINNFNELVSNLEPENNKAIYDALDKLSKLGLTFPLNILTNQKTFNVALISFYKDLVQTISKVLDFDKGIESTLNILKLNFKLDVNDFELRSKYILEISKIILNNSSKVSLLSIRSMICTNFMHEINIFSILFSNSLYAITYNEIKLFNDPIDLIKSVNFNAQDFDLVKFLQIHSRIMIILGLKPNLEDYIDSNQVFIKEFYLSVLDKFEENEVSESLIEYMICISKIDTEFEEIVTQYFEIESIESLYTNLINKCASLSLTQKTLDNIVEMNLFSKLNSDVATQFYNVNRVLEYLIIQVQENVEKISFHEKNIITTIEKNCDFLFNNYPNVWKLIRFRVSKDYRRVIEKYRFMFESKYSIITSEELYLINELSLSLDFISVPNINKANLGYICDYFNSHKRTLAESYNIIEFISKVNVNYTYEMFYLIDFNKIIYKRLSKSKRVELINLLSKQLKLNLPSEILKYMRHTQYIEENLEIEIASILKEDNILQKEYVNLLCDINKPTKTSTLIINGFTSIYKFTPLIIDKMFSEGYLEKYVLFQIYYNDCFILDDSRVDRLWPIYVDIFKNYQYNDFSIIKMSENINFLIKLVQENFHIGLDYNTRFLFYRLSQSIILLSDLDNYDVDFIISYLSNISGFDSKESAEFFLDILLNNNELLLSNVVYENCHEKLVDPILKGKYTKARNKVM